MAASLTLQPGRPLVVCADGPMSGWWFYADDFAARQESSRRTTTPFSPAAAAAVLQYERSGQTRLHPVVHVPGEVLHHRPAGTTPNRVARDRPAARGVPA